MFDKYYRFQKSKKIEVFQNEEYLWKLVRRELHKLNTYQDKQKALPRLANYISTDAGFEHAEDVIFNIAAREGISVQAAMASYDSELENHEL